MSLHRATMFVRSFVRSLLGSAGPRKRQFRPMRLEGLEVRLTPALTPIAANAGFPYTSIVKLFITFPDNQNFVGSGAMVDNFHVLTAGHNTYSAADGGFAKSIRVVPEMNRSSQPYGTAYMAYEHTYNSFINYDKSHPGGTSTGIQDIGLLTLDRSVGRSTGYMGYGYDDNNARFAAGRTFNTAGYPAAGGYDGSTMYLSSGTIAGLSSDKAAFQYYQSQITTFGGQSGSPVWEYVPSTGQRTILGVHVAGNGTASSLNFATRITHAIFDDLGRWRSADTAPIRQSAAFAGAGIDPSTGVGQDDAGAAAVVANVGAGKADPGTPHAVASGDLTAPGATHPAHNGSNALPGGPVVHKKILAHHALARPSVLAGRSTIFGAHGKIQAASSGASALDS